MGRKKKEHNPLTTSLPYWCPTCRVQVAGNDLDPNYYLVTYPDVYGNLEGSKKLTGLWWVRLVRHHAICGKQVWAKKPNGNYNPKADHP